MHGGVYRLPVVTEYLESRATSCSRPIANLSTSCTTNRAFDATAYYTAFKVVAVCVIVVTFELFELYYWLELYELLELCYYRELFRTS